MLIFDLVLMGGPGWSDFFANRFRDRCSCWLMVVWRTWRPGGLADRRAGTFLVEYGRRGNWPAVWALSLYSILGVKLLGFHCPFPFFTIPFIPFPFFHYVSLPLLLPAGLFQSFYFHFLLFYKIMVFLRLAQIPPSRALPPTSTQ